jgi:predicted AAA+ superfamily ATPase
MAQSGGIFEASRFATPCEVSRTTISNYLAVLEATFIVHVVRPFSSHKPTEIISAPKVYAFDTGFMCYYRGWQGLRREDLGELWEHFVLNEIQGHLQARKVQYWRDKRGHEVDFILTDRRGIPTAVECKWSASEFEATNIKAFRRVYDKGDNFVVANDVKRPFFRDYEGVHVKFVGMGNLIEELTPLTLL